MNRIMRKIVGVIISSLIIICSFPAVSVSASDLEINEFTFPDANFRQYVMDYFAGGSNILTENMISSITDIDVSDLNISSLEGIQYFTELEDLNCNNNQLSTLDLSCNTQLVTIDCANNRLSTLNLSNDAYLSFLYCENNQLTELDVSDNRYLSKLRCYNNQIGELTFSDNYNNFKDDFINGLAEQSKADWTFDGWCTDTSYSTLFDYNTQISGKTTIYAKWTSLPHTITVNNGTADTYSATAGETITLTADPASTNKEFDKWDLVTGSIKLTDETSITTTFVMPAENVEVTATYKDVAPKEYSVTVSAGEGGTASASVEKGTSGTEVTLTATPKDGYQFKEWQVISGGVTVASDKFTIGTENASVKAVFEEKTTSTGSTTVVANTYTVIQGNGGVWDGKSDYVIEVKSSSDDEHCIDRFKWAAVDGHELKVGEESELAVGSTIVIIKSDYLKTLGTGKHNVVVNFTDNSVATTFTVNAASTASSVPSTGELHSPAMYIGIAMIIAAACSTSVLAIRKKRSN